MKIAQDTANKHKEMNKRGVATIQKEQLNNKQKLQTIFCEYIS